MQPLIYRTAAFAEIHPLRRAVLRPGDAFLKFDGDDAPPPHAWHVGAFAPACENAGCLTLLASSWEGRPALQLRGMAVAEAWRGRGVGASLLRYAARIVALDSTARGLSWWCNARVEAIGFYARLGWQIASEEFMIETVGLHRKMTRPAAAGAEGC